MAADLKIVSSRSGHSPQPPEGGPFAQGDLVHLKSGGPLMTVQRAGPEWTQCTWFDEVGNRIGPEDFRNGTLKAYETPPKRTRRRPRPRARPK